MSFPRIHGRPRALTYRRRRRAMFGIAVAGAMQLSAVVAGLPSLAHPSGAMAAAGQTTYQTTTAHTCGTTFTINFLRPTTPGTLLVLVASISSGNGDYGISAGWAGVGGNYAPGFLYNLITYMYFDNPGGLTSVSLSTPSPGSCQSFTFVEFSASTVGGTYDTTATIQNGYGSSVSGMAANTGAMTQARELVIWATGQNANPEAYVPGSGMTPAASDGVSNGVGVSSEIEFAVAPNPSGFVASSSWSSSAPAVATITTLAVTWPTGVTPPGNPSDSCYAGTAAVDGFVGGTYIKLRAQQLNPQTELVCARLDNGQGVNFGGALQITTSGTLPGAPSSDGNLAACTQSGNLDSPPLPSPLFSNTTFFPVFTNLVASEFRNNGEVDVCVSATAASTTVAQHLYLPLPNAGNVVNAVQFLPDPAGTGVPVPTPAFGGNPSATCENGGGSALVNANLAGTQAWLYTLQERPTKLDVCVRLGQSGGDGGEMSLDTTGFPGIAPVVQTGSDTTGCTQPVDHLNTPEQVWLDISATGANPAAVCLTINGVVNRLTLGTTGSGALPNPQWNPDPGTP